MDHSILPRTIFFSAILILASFIGVAAGLAPALSEDCDERCQALRDAQDPLADVKAIMTDNTIALGTGDDQTSYSFQVQPVYSIPTDKGFNFIARGIIPVLGVQNGSYLPWPGQSGPSSLTWGISDIMMQGFIAPQTKGDLKFGFGPQISLRSRTNSDVAGPGWGAGLAGVVFGFAGNLSYGSIVGHHWGQDGFSLTSIQPIVMYSIGLFGEGSYVGYNNSITYDWGTKDNNRWQVPVGLVLGRTLILEDAPTIDLSLGAYSIVTAPKGAADTQIKFGISFFF